MNKSEIAEREIRHHTCTLVDTETDPPLMVEQEYDGSLAGDWKKFMCPVCHDRIIVRWERAIAESRQGENIVNPTTVERLAEITSRMEVMTTDGDTSQLTPDDIGDIYAWLLWAQGKSSEER